MTLRVFSTFSGISAATAAWKPLGMELVGYCEPSAFPAHVLAARCGATTPKYLPDGAEFVRKKYRSITAGSVPNFGDITQLTDDDLRSLGRVDVLEGGSPCQAFSISGLRKGLNDDRGNLALAFAQLVERMRKINGLRFVVWENVKGVLSDKTNAFGCLLAALAGGEDPLQPPGATWPNSGHVLCDDQGLGGFTAAWRTLDAQHFGVAQRRKRVFLSASFDPGIDAGSILFEHGGEERNPSPCAKTRQADPSAGGKTAGGMNVVGTLCAAGQAKELDLVVVHPAVVGTLQTGKPKGSSGSDLDFTIVHEASAAGKYVVRRLMPIECERLQGFDDGWTDVALGGKAATDIHRYKALGNSMAVPVMRWIGERLLYHVAHPITQTVELVEGLAA